MRLGLPALLARRSTRNGRAFRQDEAGRGDLAEANWTAVDRLTRAIERAMARAAFSRELVDIAVCSTTARLLEEVDA